MLRRVYDLLVHESVESLYVINEHMTLSLSTLLYTLYSTDSATLYSPDGNDAAPFASGSEAAADTDADGSAR